MITFQHILAPIDFSAFSDHALDHAVALAHWYDARVTVLHVFPIDPALPPYSEFPGPIRLQSAERERIAEALARFVGSHRVPSVPIDTVLEEGNVVAEILRRARALPADLIVVGTHGRSGFERMMLGSVTERVLRKASCPVLTVPRRVDGASPRGPAVFKRILCPVDFSPSSMKAVDYAVSLAEEAGGRLTLLHVLEWFSEEEPREHAHFSVPEYRRYMQDDARTRLQKAIPEEARLWCEPEEVLDAGNPSHQILRTAADRSADLIVMGVAGRNPLNLALFGSTAQRVVREAACPVLTIRAPV